MGAVGTGIILAILSIEASGSCEAALWIGALAAGVLGILAEVIG